MTSLLSNPTPLVIPVLSLLSLLKATAGDIELAGTVFRLHFRGALCPLYTNETHRVRNKIECAAIALTRGVSTFSFCASEDQNCAISLPTYHLGAWNSSQPHCSLYSTLLPVPPVVPKHQDTKRFVLSSRAPYNGTPESMESNNFCIADNYEFAVISSPAEYQQFFSEINTALGGGNCAPCAVWLNLLPTLHWHDGSVLNLCEIPHPIQSSLPGDCFIVDQPKPYNIFKYQCYKPNFPFVVACQTFE